MRRIIIPIFLFCNLICLGQNNLAGKYGAELKASIKASYRPTKHVQSQNQLIKVFRQTDVSDGYLIDRYSDNKYTLPADENFLPDGIVWDDVIDYSWWGENTIYGDTVLYDIYNLFPCNDEVPINKADYPPGIVNEVIYSNGVWKSGLGLIAGVSVNLYEPAEEYRGDFARVAMYMATIYSVDWWHGLGVNFFSDTEYPTLNGYAKRTLLQWHREDPVSGIEKSRNDAVEKIQGNRNPFVDFPDLVEYIWGDKSTEPYIPEQERDKSPLKAVYTIEDKYIDLYSPYIPTEVDWYIDGNKVSETSISIEDLSAGIHELKYKGENVKGKLMIKIEK